MQHPSTAGRPFQYSLKAMFWLMTVIAVTVWLLHNLNAHWWVLVVYVWVGVLQLGAARSASLAAAKETAGVNENAVARRRRLVSMAMSACALTLGSWLCAVCTLLAVKGDFWPTEAFRQRSGPIDLTAWLMLLIHVAALWLNTTSWVNSPGVHHSRALGWLQLLNLANSAMVLGFLFLFYAA